MKQKRGYGLTSLMEEPTSSELDQMQNQEKNFVDEEVEELVDDPRSR